ncbi:right-handed parallel beta-helix repeat-containing protein [Reichenbachiella carrageenanivorans]|uniref:Right-handed parallel beta-helix repeat-containing protein n=1 Tax=Reichenbachiella carrageenanivorans TaxID=2979869 RepID=A0ABY6CW13_9BACT|nr:right-handed parallel beta-helix repeat-containing protein [Reichenbachiella carrageenanivorans]UXX78104.1 right-handed parallel beta-helix repeat-containing protein [Reichenbachiella carrageenanivorans]
MVKETRRVLLIGLAIGSLGIISFLNVGQISRKIQFDTSISKDATAAVLQQFLAYDEKPFTKVTFEKGTYHFYPDKGLESFCHISNHDDVLISTAFPITNKKNITIDGQGSTFIFHGRMVPFLIEHSEYISLQNLSIDWAQTFHSEAEVVAIDEANHTFDIQISDEYPYEIRNGQVYFIKEYYEHTIGQSILYDPMRNAIAFDTESYTPVTSYTKLPVAQRATPIIHKYKADHNAPPLKQLNREWQLEMTEVAPGRVRIANHKKKLPPVGMILAAKGEQSQNRIAPAIRITHTVGFSANQVNVHHAGGMGLIAENSENLTLDNFNVIPSNGRMVSATADATHFVGCRGQVTLKNCTLNNQLDDGLNVHGTYQEVMDVLGDRQVGIRIGHYQQLGFEIGRPGDQLGLLKLDESFFPYAQLTLENIEVLNGRYQILTFKEKLPEDLESGDLLENLDAYPELLVENCDIGSNRARGLLISTPKKSVVRNNKFHTEMEAILLPVESSHWYESGSASSLLITGNTFQDCTHSGQNRGVIRLVTDDDNENVAFKNITVTHNTFNQFDNLILEINNTEKFEFSENEINNSGTFPQLFPENPVVKVRSSSQLVFENNIYRGRATTLFESDEEGAGLTF